MISKLTACLRLNTWLLLASFAAFVSASVVGTLTVDADSSTPAVWLATMWVMLAFGVLIVVLIVAECVQAVLGMGNSQ